MTKNWLWDKKTSITQVKRILRDSNHRDFIFYSSLLLERNNVPSEVFKEYLDPLLFCRRWAEIKKRMRKNKWNVQRIVFWQAIYEKLKEKYQGKGIVFREKKRWARDDLCKMAGEMLRTIREESGLSQKALSAKLEVSQQLISRIENGQENVSLLTLKNICKALGKKLKINFD